MNIDWQGASDVESLFGSLVNEQVNPYALERDRSSTPIPDEVFRLFAERGGFQLALPQRYGGADIGVAQWGSVLEKLGYLSSDMSFPFLLSVRMSFILFLAAVGRREVVAPYIDRLVAGTSIGAFAYTENADAFSFVSNARHDPDSGYYLLNGGKPYVSGGRTADLFVVFVRSDTRDLQVFLVQRSDPGVSTSPMKMSGVRALGTVYLTLDNVRLDESRLLAGTDGLAVAQRYFLNCRRSLQACPFLGHARRVIEQTIGYLQRTIRYDGRLAEMQHVQAVVGEMYIALESARSVVYRSLLRQVNGDTDPYWDSLSSAAKHCAVENITQIALSALKLTGGWGYTEESGIGRALRDFTSLFAGADPQEKLVVDLGIRKLHEFDLLSQQLTNQEGE